ncbi:Tryptophan--tRNA ligase, mitochondrial [Pseudocyphellaria aurata]|nr:Tryptophan--tRNA ligase, mitochondrial [Pseudocyphellaria aurata]
MRSLFYARKYLYEIGSPQLGFHATRLDFRLNITNPGPAYSTTSFQWQDHVHPEIPQYPPSTLKPPAELISISSQTPEEEPTDFPEEDEFDEFPRPRYPRSVQAIYLKPLKRKAKYGLPACDLQLRSYSVRNLEFFTDFALRAAYYLYLPAAGPIPLPRMIERWTVPRSNFVHKSSQENFERITLRRLIQIQDGNPETVEVWLAFLRKHAYYGIGMKANVWGHEKLGVGKTMDVSLENLKQVLEPKWAHFGRRKNLETSERVYEMMNRENFRQTSDGPMREHHKIL